MLLDAKREKKNLKKQKQNGMNKVKEKNTNKLSLYDIEQKMKKVGLVTVVY
jgi:peptidyl-tRNA hydrolase